MDNTKRYILVAEDDPFYTNVYKVKFGNLGYDVTVVQNGKMAVEEAGKRKPDIILLDVVMPKVDGFGVLKIIKNDLRFKDIPVVLLTNLGQKENVERGFELGASGYIIKAHFTPSEVVEKIKEVLKKAK